MGVTLLWIGFLSGALISVRQQDEIEWTLYGLASVVTIIAIVMIRLGQRRGLGETGRVARQSETLRDSLNRVDTEVRAMFDARQSLDVYSVHARIDAVIMPPIAEFVDVRESMIEAYGLDTYAKVMTDFALAERMLNRAWCASADGYIDEVWASVGRAVQALQRARDALPEG